MSLIVPVHEGISTEPEEKTDTMVNKEEVRHMTAEDRATALRLAMDADPGIPAASLRYVKFVLMMLAICLCGGDSGFDGTCLSSINSMSQFQQFFGLESSAPSTSIVFVSPEPAGPYQCKLTQRESGHVQCRRRIWCIPCLLPTRSRWPVSTHQPVFADADSRYTMFIGNTFLIGGAILTGLAKNFSMLIWGRCVTGFGCTMAAAAALVSCYETALMGRRSSYMSEITSPATRGRWLGLLNSFYYVGQITASGVAVPLGRSSSNWAWRTPMLLQVAPALINASVILLMPESPRWLFAHGHPDKAAIVLAKLHSRDNDVNSPLVRLELGEFAENISLTGEWSNVS